MRHEKEKARGQCTRSKPSQNPQLTSGIARDQKGGPVTVPQAPELSAKRATPRWIWSGAGSSTPYKGRRGCTVGARERPSPCLPSLDVAQARKLCRNPNIH